MTSLVELSCVPFLLREPRGGRTWWLSPLSPYGRARIDFELRVLRLELAEASEYERAVADVHEGRADSESEWGKKFLDGDLGPALLLLALLFPRHEDVTRTDVIRLLSYAELRPRIRLALSLFVPPKKFESRPEPVSWHEILGAAYQCLPGRAPHELARLSDAEILALTDWRRKSLGVKVLEGDADYEETLGPAEGGSDAQP